MRILAEVRVDLGFELLEDVLSPDEVDDVSVEMPSTDFN